LKILVLGAGVLGTLYAARLYQAGYDVTVLARGQRLAELRARGALLQRDGHRARFEVRLPVLDRLTPTLAFDWAIVLVRREQLEAALEEIAPTGIPNVLIMTNNAAGTAAIEARLGSRALLGFAGAGGGCRDGVVSYTMLPGWFQPTTLGEIDGQITDRLRWIAAALHRAGFPVALCPRMDAWLKTHAALVSPIANAIALAGGDPRRLALTPDGLLLMIRAMREQFRVLRALRIPITPSRLALLRWVPEPLLQLVFKRVMGTRWAERVIARHANAAPGEMRRIAEELRDLAQKAGQKTPVSDALFQYTDPTAEPMETGRRTMNPSWNGTLFFMGLGILWVFFAIRRRCRR
jgi:2-dehydropantoate 2-reductase